ncbi:MAG: hypothetical protein D6732_10400, partial [Methanobacteriota archaeon]
VLNSTIFPYSIWLFTGRETVSSESNPAIQSLWMFFGYGRQFWIDAPFVTNPSPTGFFISISSKKIFLNVGNNQGLKSLNLLLF